MDNFDLKKYLAEGKLFENTNPIWVIDASEDSADIIQAGPEYKTAVINIIKAKHPNISDKDLEASIEVVNDTWYNEARENAKGDDPEEMEVSAEDFADGAIEHYEDAYGEDNSTKETPDSEGNFEDELEWTLEQSGLFRYKDLPEEGKREFMDYVDNYLRPNNLYKNREIIGALERIIKKQLNENKNKMDNFDLKKYLAEGRLLKEAFYPEFEGETNDKINDIAIAVVDELESKLSNESSGILKGMDYYVGSDGMDNDEVEQGFTKWFINLVKYLSKNNNEVTISSVEQDGKVFTPAITLKYLDNGKEDISWKLKRDLAEGTLLKEDQMMGKYIQTKHPDGYDMIMSFSMPDEEELGLDYGTLDEILEVKEINGVKVYCVYV